MGHNRHNRRRFLEAVQKTTASWPSQTTYSITAVRSLLRCAEGWGVGGVEWGRGGVGVLRAEVGGQAASVLRSFTCCEPCPCSIAHL
jgi:hypothetical protein